MTPPISKLPSKCEKAANKIGKKKGKRGRRQPPNCQNQLSALFLGNPYPKNKSQRHCARQFVKMIDCRLNNENRASHRKGQFQTGSVCKVGGP